MDKAPIITTYPGTQHSVCTVEPDSPQAMKLLTRAYRNVYCAEFPPDQREPLEFWTSTLNGENDFSDIVITITGDDLDTDKPTIMGISVAYYYKGYDVGLMGYTIVDPFFQDQEGQLEKAMFGVTAARLEEISTSYGGNLVGVYFETDNPAKSQSDENRNQAQYRLEMLKSLGAQVVNIDYVSPPVTEGGSKNENLLLMAYHDDDGSYPDAKQIASYLQGLYAGLEEFAGCSPDKNPDLTKMKKQLQQLTQLYVSNQTQPTRSLIPPHPQP